MSPEGILIVLWAVGVAVHAGLDIAKSWRKIREIDRKIARLQRRKQDWSPREDPALWRTP